MNRGCTPVRVCRDSVGLSHPAGEAAVAAIAAAPRHLFLVEISRHATTAGTGRGPKRVPQFVRRFRGAWMGSVHHIQLLAFSPAAKSCNG